MKNSSTFKNRVLLYLRNQIGSLYFAHTRKTLQTFGSFVLRT
jgi:hypothetical protein